MKPMTADELEEIKERLATVSSLEWMRRYASDEIQQIVYGDMPQMIQFIEETLEQSKPSQGVEHERHVEKRQRRKSR
jgi:hypothetical protein